MAPADKKIIAIIGATGNQGSSVAETFLSLPNWHVRCLTRNASSEKAKDLATRGAEIVQANLEDVPSLTRALDGANAIFLNTDFWEVWRPAKAALDAQGKSYEEASAKAFASETTQGKNAVDVAATLPTLERLVVSTLPSISKATNGKHNKAKHPEAKAWIADYIETTKPSLAKKTSLIILGAYHDNRLVIPTLDPRSGKHMIALPFSPDFRMPIINAKQSTGKFVRALIEDEAPRTNLLAYDTYPTMAEIVRRWSEENGKEASYQQVGIDVIRQASGLSDEHLDVLAGASLGASYTGTIERVVEPEQLMNGGK